MRVGAVVVVVALLGAGCSGASKGATGDGSGFSIAAVAAGTIAARTAHVEGTLTGTDGGHAIHGSFTGDADFSRRASEMKVDESRDDPGDNPLGPVEFIVVGGDTYFRFDGADSTAFGAQFIKLPGGLFGGDGASVPFGMSLVGFGVADPVGALRQLRSLATRVRTVGHEKLDGIDTTHEQLTETLGVLFDCPKLPAPTASDPDQPSDTPCADSELHQTAKIDVWVDGQSRMVRLGSTITTDGSTITSRIDYSRFGDPVHIAKPSKAQTIDEDALGNPDTELGGHTTLTGAWHAIASGTYAGVHWTLSAAPAKQTVCLDFTAVPAVTLDPIIAMGPTVTRDGRAVPCVGSVVSSFQHLSLVSGVSTGAITAVVGTADATVHGLVAHFAGGASAPVAIDARTGTFVFVGAPTNRIVSLTAQAAAGEVTCADAATLMGTNVDAAGLGYLCVPTAQIAQIRSTYSTMPSGN